jgi:hypothetical protein
MYQDEASMFLYVLSTKMKGTGSFKALASIYQATPPYIQEEAI